MDGNINRLLITFTFSSPAIAVGGLYLVPSKTMLD